MLKKIFSRKKKQEVTEYAEIAGYRFSVLNPMTMPKIRQSAYYIGDYQMEWGMEKQHLLAFDDMLIGKCGFPEAWTSKDDLIKQLTERLRDVQSLAEKRRLVVQEDFQYAPFLKSACYIILIEGEDPNRIDPKWMDLKLNLCKQHEEVLLFFSRVIRGFHRSILPSFDISKMWDWYPPKHLLLTEKMVLDSIGTTILSTGTSSETETSSK